MTRTTARDIICRLIKWGYDNEDNIRKRPVHLILERYKWFEEDYRKEKEQEAKNSFVCPLMGKQKASKKRKV